MVIVTKDKPTRASPTINKLIAHFEMSNIVDGKSNSTITWYRDILKLFSRYLKENMHTNRLETFNIENAREYVLYLRSREKFGRHPNTAYSGENGPLVRAKCATSEKGWGSGAGMILV